jgi:LacI family transcriptional regulator
METKPDGMIMAPNFHDAAKQVIPQCSAQNMPLMLIDNNIENGSGLAYFGQDAFRSGMVAAKLMHYGLRPKGSVLIINLARNKVITRHMQRREQGFKHFFDTEVPEHHIHIRSIEIDLSQEMEPLSTLQKVIGEQHAIDGIFVTNSRVHKVARFLAGKGAHRLTLIGYDLIEANLEFLEKGAIDYLICQKPQDQGYKSAMAMFNYLLTGKQAEKVNFSPIDIVMRENADYYRSINNIKSV